MLDDLFTYRLDADRYLTVTNAANHARRPGAGFSTHAHEFPEVEVIDRIDDYAMLAVQGPRAREIVQAISDSPLPARMTAASRRLAGREVLVCGTGYTGEDGVELLCAPEDAPALWDEVVLAGGALPAGLAARDTLRLEACFHLYGNELTRRARPDRSRARLVLQGGHRLHRLAGGARRARARARPRSSSPSSSTARASPARATGSWAAARSRAARSRPASAWASAWPTCPPSAPRSAPHLEIDVRGKMRPAVVKQKPLYRRASVNGAGKLPRDLLYHAEHDWARIDAGEPQHATLGITWYAQDALGEVVFFEPPPSARRLTRTPPTPRSSR